MSLRTAFLLGAAAVVAVAIGFIAAVGFLAAAATPEEAYGE